MLTPFNNTPTLPRGQQQGAVQGGEQHPLDQHDKALPTPLPNPDNTCNDNNKNSIEKQLRSIAANLQHLVDHHQENDEENEILDEWKWLATAVDRLCLILFLSASLILVITLAAELMGRNDGDYGPPVQLENQKVIMIPPRGPPEE